MDSPALNAVSGLKAGGILVADSYSYSNPTKNNLVVKGSVGIGTPLTSNPNNYSLLVNGTVNAGGLYVNDEPMVSSQWTSGNDIIHYDKAVGIGTSLSANPNAYKLAVNGKIGAHEVRVEQSSATWPDYVFSSNYSLPTLKEVEAFIKANNHLMDVPSATDVEEKGHDLGTMDAILLKKVEELTLYIIEQEKRINAQQEEIERLKKK